MRNELVMQAIPTLYTLMRNATQKEQDYSSLVYELAAAALLPPTGARSQRSTIDPSPARARIVINAENGFEKRKWEVFVAVVVMD